MNLLYSFILKIEYLSYFLAVWIYLRSEYSSPFWVRLFVVHILNRKKLVAKFTFNLCCNPKYHTNLNLIEHVKITIQNYVNLCRMYKEK